MRPPLMWSMVAAVIAVMAGVRAGICMMAASRPMCSVWPQAVGLLGHDEIVGVHAHAEVAEVDGQPHA